jgi:choline dehydrogenase
MSEVRYQNPLSKRVLEVGAAAGLGPSDDFHDWLQSQDGVGRLQVLEQNGERCSDAMAYLDLARKHSNVAIRTGTMWSDESTLM